MTQFEAQTAYESEKSYAIANPSPLGLLTLALTTVLVGASFARFLIPYLRIGTGTVVAPVLVYGGVIQVLAGMWAFRKHQTLPATLFSAYGGFLIALGAVFLLLIGLVPPFGTDPLAVNHALGLLFLCWAISLGVLFLGALRTSVALLLVVACLCLSYLLLAIGEFANANYPLLAIGGWIGIVGAVLAWYTALGAILRAMNSPFQLPTGERGGVPSAFGRPYEGEPAV